jgi:hypothetical protein
MRSVRAGSDTNDTDGIVDGHAYSLIATKKNVRAESSSLLPLPTNLMCTPRVRVG